MIVKNFLEAEHRVVQGPHKGKGTATSTHLLRDSDFATNLKFINYTELHPGASIGYHPHGDNEEVYVILEGEGMMNVNGETRPVHAGDVILNKPGWSHGLENGPDRNMRVLVFEVAGTAPQ